MESYRNLGKNGQVYFYSEFSGEFSKNLHKFFMDVVKNFANISMSFIRSDYGDFPFVYGEKTLPSVLIPAFRMTSDSGIVFSEYPVNRKKLTKREVQGSEEKAGRVDYIVFHKGKEILIESKFSWISYKSLKEGKGITKKHIELIGKVLQQLRSIKWKGAEKIAFMVIPVYYPVTSLDNDIEIFKSIEPALIEKLTDRIYSEILTLTKNFLEEFQPFLGYWSVPTPHEYYIEWEKKYEAYPYILFIGGRL